MAVAFSTLLIATIKQTGGFNGLNTFTTFFGHNLYDPEVKKNLYLIAAGLVIVLLVIVWQLYRSRYGELLVATRDAEERIRFLGYDPANIKLVAFVVAAVMASIGGAMFVPIAGIISPSNVDATASIMLLAGVALGGRASLLGPALGAIAVGYGQSTLSEKFPTQWTYFQGALFIVVMLFLPGGVASLWPKLKALWPSRSPCGQQRRAPSRRPKPEVRGMTASFLGEDYLEIRDLTVDFDGFKAVDGVDLTLLQGRLHFLIGPNGAGKTTLVDALTGLVHGTGQAEFRDHDLLDDEVAQDRAPRHRPDLPDRDGVRAAQRAAEPRHRRRRAPQGAGRLLLARRQGARARRAGAGDHRPDRAGAPTGRDPRPRAEAVARGRHAAGAGRQGDVPRRDGRRHEHRGARGDRRAAASGSSATGPSSSSSTTWSSCARYADFVTVMHAGKVLAEGTVAEIQADPQVQEVYLGTVTEVARDG